MQKLLTISIPTYNRFWFLKETIDKLLSIDNNQFEIKIQDNYSSDNTYSYFKNLNNDRIIYNRNSSNLGPTQNYLKALTNNNSMYTLFIIDKDYIDINGLLQFVKLLEEEKPDYGFIKLNVNDLESNIKIKYSSGKESICNTAYLSMHPSGLFYKSDLITNNIKILSDFFIKNSTFPFPFEIINAHIGLNKSATIYNFPFISQEKEINAVNNQSYTYNSSNMFFFPSRRIETYMVYLNDLKSLNLTKSDEWYVFKKLYKRTLDMVSFSFLNLMNNKTVLIHYNIQERKIELSELINNINTLNLYSRQLYKNHKIKLFKISLLQKTRVIYYYMRLHLMKTINNIMK